MSYREPTKSDIGKIVEVTDFEADWKNRRWVKQRLIDIDLTHPHKFVCGSAFDSVEQAVQSGDYDSWLYARIEEAK